VGVQLKDLPEAAAVFLRRPVVIILIIGIVIRLVLMPLLTHGYDVMYWALTMQHVQAGAGLYDINGFWYTPVWGYMLSIMTYLSNLLGVADYGSFFDGILDIEGLSVPYTATVTTIAFNFVVKIPSLIADILVGYLIYKIILGKTEDEKKATYGFALWFLCPFVIYISAVHGMFDSIYVMFMVLSVYAMYKGHDFLAGASLSVAVLLKIFPAFIVFALIAYLAMKHKGDMRTFRNRMLTALLGLGLMTLVIYIPQILDGTIMDSLKFITSRTDPSPAVEAVEGAWDTLVSFGMKFVIWLQPILFVLTGALVYIICRRGRGDTDKIFFTCLMVSTAAVFLWPATSQFLLMTLPFLICFIAMYDKRFIIPFIVITVGALCLDLSNLSIFMSLAVYTDLLDPGSVVSLLKWMDQPLVMGLTKQYVIMILAGAAEVIGTALVLLYWIRHEKEARPDA